MPDAVARRGLGRILDRRVVVEDVDEPGEADRPDQIGSCHRVHQHVRSRAEFVQPFARDRVARDDHGPPVLLDPEADGRADRGVIGGRGGDPDRSVLQHGAPLALDHLGGRPPLQIVVVRQAVADVELQHGLGGLQERRRADRSVDGKRLRLERRDPARSEDVVEIGGVIAVQVGQKEPAQRPRGRPGGGGTHQHATPAVEEQVAGRGTHQRRRPGALGMGQWAPTAEDDELHRWRLLGSTHDSAPERAPPPPACHRLAEAQELSPATPTHAPATGARRAPRPVARARPPVLCARSRPPRPAPLR